MKNVNQQIKQLNQHTFETDFINLIDSLKRKEVSFDSNLLVDLLSERHPLYKNRGSIASQKMRGYLIAAFREIGTPSKALPYLLEELETSFYPYIVAATAKAIRGLKEPHAGIAAFLNKSIYNIWQTNVFINYSSYTPPYPDENTMPLWEIFDSLIWLKGKAKYVLPDLYHLEGNLNEFLNDDNKHRLAFCIESIENSDELIDECCTIPIEIYSSSNENSNIEHNIDLSNIILEDENAVKTSWSNFFKGNYTVLSFFYTRCHNPRKCIQTIYNLIDIQKIIKSDRKYANIQTAAITYDPDFDKSTILKSYGDNRRFQFDDGNKMFRVQEGMESLIEQLNIGVNYKGDSVNIHRIEVYIINPEGKIEKSFLRFQAKPDLIINELNQLLKIKSIENVINKPKLITKISTSALPVLIAFFPKCSMCWAAYLNLLGISSIVTIKHQPWLVFVFIGFVFFNLINLFRLAKKRNGLLPFYLATIGSIILGLNYWLELNNSFLIIGFICVLIATLLNSLNFKYYYKLIQFFNKKWIVFKYN